ncbi:alpha/beta fold hydrolase [Ilumatobacter coccineus]|uniref:Putative esterase n=1 Tax=Ilumatobacter coccineus (strain NBRC 103263 / KCTC 29153 / YM16-304) TaxID=1313172 RepID=A0A6C7E6F6_ILUCY|nr:alpha/beta fold hydrolase [Ilumatobacter coccineus]BAN00839.1 putative esterase [Ilumatobacter coccineus YM16-304]
MSSTSENATFVFVHGAHHDGGTWDDLVPELEARGHGSVTLDLPGAGVNAAEPESLHVRPLDPVAFGTEPSPNAGVTQDERTAAVIEAVQAAAAMGNGDVVLVGHSLGGLTTSVVTEAIPEKLKATVFLASFLAPNGMIAGALLGHESMADSHMLGLLMADPGVVGAIRIDTRSTDPEYLAKVKAAFYADLTDSQFEAAMGKLHSDEPAQVGAEPSNITAENFGQVDRHYIRCAQDNVMTPACQDLVVQMVDESLGSTTTVHEMNTSHSPFYSDPAGLADILASIAASPSAE